MLLDSPRFENLRIFTTWQSWPSLVMPSDCIHSQNNLWKEVLPNGQLPGHCAVLLTRDLISSLTVAAAVFEVVLPLRNTPEL